MKERLLVVRHVKGSVWYLADADGTPVCDLLGLGWRVIDGHRMPETWLAGEQVGEHLYCPYSSQQPVYELRGRAGWPRPRLPRPAE